MCPHLPTPRRRPGRGFDAQAKLGGLTCMSLGSLSAGAPACRAASQQTGQTISKVLPPRRAYARRWGSGGTRYGGLYIQRLTMRAPQTPRRQGVLPAVGATESTRERIKTSPFPCNDLHDCKQIGRHQWPRPCNLTRSTPSWLSTEACLLPPCRARCCWTRIVSRMRSPSTARRRTARVVRAGALGSLAV